MTTHGALSESFRKFIDDVKFIIGERGIRSQNSGVGWTTDDLTFQRSNTQDIEVKKNGITVLSFPDASYSSQRLVWEGNDDLIERVLRIRVEVETENASQADRAKNAHSSRGV